MGFLDSLFSDVKAFVREAVKVVAEVVQVVLEEIDRSPFGKATTRFIDGASKKYFDTASDLAEEEKYFAEKFRRDCKRTSGDKDRLDEIQADRDKLKRELDELHA